MQGMLVTLPMFGKFLLRKLASQLILLDNSTLRGIREHQQPLLILSLHHLLLGNAAQLGTHILGKRLL